MHPRQPKPLLQATGLCFGYPGQPLFSNFSASIPPGITLICGGDGRGKSTLVALLAGALAAQSGALHIKGIALQTDPAKYKAQVFWAEPRCAAFDTLSVPSYFAMQRSRFASFDDGILADVTIRLGLQDHVQKQLFMLSTGSKRKVFLAAALASGAAVTLLDEPLAALDAASIGFVLAWLQSQAHSRLQAWVMADHAAPQGLSLMHTIDLGD